MRLRKVIAIAYEWLSIVLKCKVGNGLKPSINWGEITDLFRISFTELFYIDLLYIKNSANNSLLRAILTAISEFEEKRKIQNLVTTENSLFYIYLFFTSKGSNL